MMPRYAQIDQQGICIAVSDLSGVVDAPNMVEVGAGENPIGRKWEADDWVDVPQPTPDPAPATPYLYAAAQLRIADFDITGIGVNSRFAGAFWGDVGKYFVFFAEPQPDTAYIAMADGGPCRAYVLDADKAEDFFVVTVTDQAGAALDAEVVNISIVRAG